jgi:hypothetical protein
MGVEKSEDEGAGCRTVEGLQTSGPVASRAQSHCGDVTKITCCDIRHKYGLIVIHVDIRHD